MSEDHPSVIVGRNRDCFACRLISGGGLIGAGAYVAHHSKKFTRNTGKTVMYSIAVCLAGLGAARIFSIAPFNKNFGHRVNGHS